MGENKKLMDKYEPKQFEDKLYKQWEEKGYFKPSKDKTKKPYCIMMPPPNVTGKLHMGHALDDTIQDILIRYKRMAGYNCLWLPGTDHSAISTEMKVVQKLKEEGKTKYEIGRDKFLEKTWEWTKLYGGTIQSQQRRLGCSCDWEHKRFTMDEGLSKAVTEEFIRLYEKGLIYKGKRMVNWCTSCNTSISDVEVEYHEEKTYLWHIKYKVVDEDRYIIVATTRPETMLGDTAVAVHPEDERYKDLVGKKVILPIMNKEIPIIADRFVEKEFGTGAVKITPAHDMNDYQAGLRNNLDIVQVFDENFKMGNLVPEYEGMDIYEARKEIVKKLKELGVLVKEEEYIHNVAKCERCKSTIEPKISDQWFVKMKDLVKPAIDVVKSGKIRFIPERFSKNYFHWMENIQDWCISRQIWWGHRIPVYYCEECDNQMVERQMPQKCTKCGSTNIVQDSDTLDTWFSSALWPFSTLGWPDNTDDLAYYYPTSTLVTGYDIITFWVSRMVTTGMEFMKEIPFKDVLIHGIVRDSQGRKMSKSLGNGIDPIEIIDKYGTDSLRFSLILGISAGNDIRYVPEKLEAAQNFANKIWNAAKFITMNLAEDKKIMEFAKLCKDEETKLYKKDLLKIEDRWIINKLDQLIEEVTKNIENYELGIALDKVYNFIWNEFCDWYIEIAKSRLYGKNEQEKVQVSFVLNYVFGNCLKLLHPFMPFITSEIYSKLANNDDKDIMVSNWPKTEKRVEYDTNNDVMELFKQVIVEIRNIRSKLNVHPSKKSKLIFVTKDFKKEIEESKGFITKLAFADEIIIQENKDNIPQNAISILVDNLDVFIPFEDLVDIEEEKNRLQEEVKRLTSEVARGEKILSNQGFLNKAPKEKIKEEEEKLKNYKQLLQTTKERLDSIK